MAPASTPNTSTGANFVPPDLFAIAFHRFTVPAPLTLQASTHASVSVPEAATPITALAFVAV